MARANGDDRCDGRLIMFLAIDRVSKFTDVAFHDSAGTMEGSAFLGNVGAAFPYKLHTVPSDNGMAFADLPKRRPAQEQDRAGSSSDSISSI